MFNLLTKENKNSCPATFTEKSLQTMAVSHIMDIFFSYYFPKETEGRCRTNIEQDLNVL